MDILKIKFLFFVYILLCTQQAIADSCPTVKDISYRLISRDYEWTVDEGVTLDDLLSVKQLIAVSIENEGEFVSCKYKTGEKFIKLDGLPDTEKCPLQNTSGNWFVTGTNRWVCDEEDLFLCVFDTDCKQED